MTFLHASSFLPVAIFNFSIEHEYFHYTIARCYNFVSFLLNFEIKCLRVVRLWPLSESKRDPKWLLTCSMSSLTSLFTSPSLFPCDSKIVAPADRRFKFVVTTKKQRKKLFRQDYSSLLLVVIVPSVFSIIPIQIRSVCETQSSYVQLDRQTIFSITKSLKHTSRRHQEIRVCELFVFRGSMWNKFRFFSCFSHS